jgi:hypothetical protein
MRKLTAALIVLVSVVSFSGCCVPRSRVSVGFGAPCDSPYSFCPAAYAAPTVIHETQPKPNPDAR